MTDLSGRSDADSRAIIADAGARRGISIEESAREAMHAHAAGTTSVEIGGVLVGDVDEETGEIYITAAIPAHRATSAVASLTFTHEAWDDVNEIMSRDYAGQRMVGWYHSHPRFGIFLSEYDVFIQKNFFREVWQVAYVVDPVSETSGVFGWEHGEIVRYLTWNIVVRGASKSVREPDRGGPARRTARASPPAPEPVEVQLDDDGPSHARPLQNGSKRRFVVGGLAVLVVAAIAAGVWLSFGAGPSRTPRRAVSASRHDTTTTGARSTSGRHSTSGSGATVVGPHTKNAFSGTVAVTGSGQPGLTEHWALLQTPGVEPNLYRVTITFSRTGTGTRSGTVQKCTPSAMPSVNGPTTGVTACNLSFHGTKLLPGHSEQFLFIAQSIPAARPTPSYVLATNNATSADPIGLPTTSSGSGATPGVGSQAPSGTTLTSQAGSTATTAPTGK